MSHLFWFRWHKRWIAALGSASGSRLSSPKSSSSRHHSGVGVGMGWDRYRLGHPALKVLAQAPRLMYSQATVRSYTKNRAVLRKVWGGFCKPVQHHRNPSCGNLPGRIGHRSLHVLCGGKGTAPECVSGSPKVPSAQWSLRVGPLHVDSAPII